MGCTQSKIENEEAVTRCKSRRQFMKEAVSARNAFAAAHSGYAMYLKNTGAALSDFGQGEVQNPLMVQTQSNSSSSQAQMENLRPPPPPPDNFTAVTGQIQRAASMPPIIPKPDPVKPKPKRIDEEDEEDEISNEGSLRRRVRSRSSGGGHKEVLEEDMHKEVVEEDMHKEVVEEDMDAPLSVPPSPTRAPPRPPSFHGSQVRMPHPPSHQHDSTWDYFFNVDNIPRPTLDEVEEDRINEEEIDRTVLNERPDRVNVLIERQRKAEAEELVMHEKPVEPPVTTPPMPMSIVEEKKNSKKVKMGGSTSGEGKRGKNVNLLQIFCDLDDHFLKASESAHEVSKMLEATRLHYHSNFADNRGNSLDLFSNLKGLCLQVHWE